MPKVTAPREVEQEGLNKDDGRRVRVVVELDVAPTLRLSCLRVLGNMDAELLLLAEAILDEEGEMAEENLPVDSSRSIGLRRPRERGKGNVDVEGLVVLREVLRLGTIRPNARNAGLLSGLEIRLRLGVTLCIQKRQSPVGGHALLTNVLQEIGLIQLLRNDVKGSTGEDDVDRVRSWLCHMWGFTSSPKKEIELSIFSFFWAEEVPLAA